MALYFRNDAWKEDLDLKEGLKKYVGQLLKREEILSFVPGDYSILRVFARSIAGSAILGSFTATGTTLGKPFQRSLMDLANFLDTGPYRKRFDRSMN